MLYTPSMTLQRYNSEVLFDMSSANLNFLLSTTLRVDTVLISSYATTDRRKDVFFRISNGRYTSKQSYGGGPTTRFTGLATDEVYLIRAECNARKGNTAVAMSDLNTLLRNRISPFADLQATSPTDALQKILAERRKELCFRGVRWSDFRRLNKEPQFAVTLIRKIKGQTFTLPPNDQRYVLPIPPVVIFLTGIPQNPR